jgi:hypothetical protein
MYEDVRTVGIKNNEDVLTYKEVRTYKDVLIISTNKATLLHTLCNEKGI